GGPQRGGQQPLPPSQRDAPPEQSFARAMLDRGQQQQASADPFPALGPAAAARPPPPQQQQQPPAAPKRPPQTSPPAAQPAPPPPQAAAAGDPFEMRGMAQSLPRAIVPIKRTPFPQRPSAGKLGRPIAVVANHFAMELPNGNVYHYDVAILPPQRKEEAKAPEQKKMRALSTTINRRVIQQLVNKYRGELNKCLPAYDGRKNLYTRRKLPFEERVFTVDFEEDEPRREGDRVSQFTVKIHYAATVNLDALHAVYNNQVRTVPQEVIQALDIIMRHGPCMQWTPVGRSIFKRPEPQERPSIGGGQEVWFGYYTSVRPAQWKPMLNVDRSATSFYEEQTLLEFMEKKFSDYRRKFSPDPRGLNELHIATLNKELRTLKVAVMHLPYPRKYRVVKVTRESARAIRFKLDDGSQISVADYFRKKYPNFAKYPQLPCIMAGSVTRPNYIPLEACKIVGGQPYRRKLAPDMTKEMIKRTALPPAQRFEKIQSAVRDVVQASQPYLNEFGIKISTDPTQLKGRVLEAPTIVMGNKRELHPREGSWDLRNVQFHQPATIKSWLLLGMNTQRLRKDEYDKFSKLFQQTARSLGMSVSEPMNIVVENSTETKTSDILMAIKQKYAGVELVVVVLGRDACYADIKQAAETSLGMRTQCITEQNFTRNCNSQLMVNLCQKINAKMGGINNGLLPAQKPEIFRKPIIIIGADVSHPAPGDRIKPSIAACVGSLDSIPSKYRASIRVQIEDREAVARVEMIQDLKGMVMELLKAFFAATRHKPEHIIFYRDGVSEGQFAEVRDLELQAIRDACLALQRDGSYKPPVTFIVVQKRHHTRFMPSNERDGVGRCKNVPPGTTVDTVVTHPVDFDFFLCSHYGIQGTSKPAHYYVVHDDYNFTSDDLQKLSYYLCHTYARCARSVSIPAPVYYAHLAAFRAKEHIVSAVDVSSATSESSGGDAGVSTKEYEDAVALTEKMKEVMYFV
ncbi:unnamed protein product, partial [Ixodes hexagonus]